MTEPPSTHPRVSPLLAALASTVLPGLGQLLNGEQAKGWSLICTAAGISLSVALFASAFSRALLLIAYACIWFPTITDAYQTAAGRPRAFAGSRPGYVIMMLLIAGPFALSLLWTSPHFSRRAKIIWSVCVCGLALLFILTLGPLGRWLEQLQRDLQPSLLPGLQ